MLLTLSLRRQAEEETHEIDKKFNEEDCRKHFEFLKNIN